MNLNLRITLLAVLLLPLFAFAQSGTVSGVVTDAETNLPLLGVSVVVKGTSIGTATDFDGKYTLTNVPEDAVLTFSYLGYASTDVNVEGRTQIDVRMDEEASSLEEVVLLAYGTTTQENVTAAQETVKAEEFNQGAIVSPGQQLAGKAAGVQVVAPSGRPGDGPVIRVRAGSTLSATQDPLYVVDGVPLDQGNANLNTLNPNDIESYTILKDASATAIYGNRASNGVILITTKKADLSSDLKVSYDVQFALESRQNELDVLSADEFRSLTRERGRSTNLLSFHSTDWQDEIFQTGTRAIHNLVFSKGFESTSVRFSLNHTGQEGILRTSSYERASANLNVIQKLLNRDLTLTLSVQGALETIGNADEGAIGAAVVFDPTRPVRSNLPDRSLNGFFEFYDDQGNIEVNAPANPVGLLESWDAETTNDQIRANLNADYKLPIEGLKFVGNAGIDYNEFNVRQERLVNSRAGIFSNGFRGFENGFRRNVVLNGRFDYKRVLDFIDTEMEATVGSSYQDFTRETFTQRTNDGVLEPEFFFPSDNRLISAFGRLSFDISDLVVLSGSISRDGSSRFPPGEKFGTFGGASVALKLGNLDFFQDSGVISQLKLRGGYGRTGQQEIGPDFSYISVFTPGRRVAQVQFGDEFVQTIRPEGTEDLVWEKTDQYNIGLDLGLFDDRISFTADAYYRETSDLLQFAPVAAGGLENFLVQNVGSTASRGLELAMGLDVIRSQDMNWSIRPNLTFQEIEITNLAGPNNDPVDVGGISGGVGNTIQQWNVGADPTSYHVFRQVYDENGNPLNGVYVDVNGDNVINGDDRVRYKKANPDAFFGFTSLFNYKQLDFSFTFRGQVGGYNYNNVDSNSATFENIYNNPGSYYTNSTTDIFDSGFTDPQFFSDYYIQSSDFVKLDNATIGYSFPGDKVDLRASITGVNLLVITDYDGVDPEVFQGIDNNLFPRARGVVFGLGATF